MEEGCIVIRGSIRDSILWKDPVKLRWFLDMLLLADHPDAEKSKSGQIVMSLGNWSKRWLVSRDVVRHFFEFLEKNGIILRDRCAQQSAQFYAQITICGFDVFKAAATAMKKAYDAGEAIGKVIQDAIDYITKETGVTDWDKVEFTKEWEGILGERLS